ncbi:2-phosphosulfolactate phosphatase [Paenibacillus filicis]|uniref:Probable 2-phosphosulfolactate phosphatase n=1 Tax=Paenibacillus gyeongsangnamensis TaxID=3388067 RepID=A0ABT4Q7P5_9BACL|nr:2-phosphosulfolactate phosphatase [Paenibacillus filicis]MCZ8512811.1 2-phosphosulfolactate phosphatase [Paenibacillus filicis]
MNIQVIPTVMEARTEELHHKTVVVIDVLRATSTLLTALVNGCKEVIPTETVNGAKSLQQEGDLLGGERGCKKIPGFDLGNSPLEYEPAAVTGKRIILTTTNGTRAIQKAGKISRILVGSLLNARACAARAMECGGELVILCSGTQDVFSLEDGLCAGAILDELIQIAGGAEPDNAQTSFKVNDFGLGMLYAYRGVRDRLTETLLASANGKRLTKLGCREDVLYCAQRNTIGIAPEVRGGKVEALTV